MRPLQILIIAVVTGGCSSGHIKGSGLKPSQCPGDGIVVAENRTSRSYDVMYDDQKIGTLGPNGSVRIRVASPVNGKASLKEADTKRMPQVSDPQGRPVAPRIICAP